MVAGGSVTFTERRQKTREGIRSLVRLKSDDNRAQVDCDGPTSANRSIHAGQSTRTSVIIRCSQPVTQDDPAESASV